MGARENLDNGELVLEMVDLIGGQFFVQSGQECCPSLFEDRLIPVPSTDMVNFAFTETEGRIGVLLALLYSFAEVHREYPDICLYILGECPMIEKIEREIKKLQLEQEVFLVGKVENPSVITERCQCLPAVIQSSGNISPEAFWPFMQEILLTKNLRGTSDGKES